MGRDLDLGDGSGFDGLTTGLLSTKFAKSFSPKTPVVFSKTQNNPGKIAGKK